MLVLNTSIKHKHINKINSISFSMLITIFSVICIVLYGIYKNPASLILSGFMLVGLALSLIGVVYIFIDHSNKHNSESKEMNEIDSIEKLERLAKLHENKSISNEEYTIMKSKMIDKR